MRYFKMRIKAGWWKQLVSPFVQRAFKNIAQEPIIFVHVHMYQIKGSIPEHVSAAEAG